MTDNGLRQVFQNGSVVVTEDEVERALVRTRVAGRVALRRRRRATFLAPCAAALATAAVVTVIVVAGPSANRPKPSPAASVPPLPSPTSRVWFKHINGAGSTASGATVDVGGIWVIRLATDVAGTFDLQPRDRLGQGTLTYDPATRLWSVRVLQRYCGDAAASYRIDNSHLALTFTAVHDPCTLRRDVLDGTVFDVLTSPDQLIG